MIGPGAWSLDAWLFGRKHIEPPELWELLNCTSKAQSKLSATPCGERG
jgi:hypothetical protein